MRRIISLVVIGRMTGKTGVWGAVVITVMACKTVVGYRGMRWIICLVIIRRMTAKTGVWCIVVITVMAGKTIVGYRSMSTLQNVILVMNSKGSRLPVGVCGVAGFAGGWNCQRAMVWIC